MTPAEAARKIALDLGLAGTVEQDRIADVFDKFADLLESERAGRACSYCDGTGIVPGSEGQVWAKGRGWHDPEVSAP